MTQELSRENRNDLPDAGETKADMIARRKEERFQAQLPSRNKPARKFKVPPGAVSIYRITSFDWSRPVYHGLYRDEKQAYRIADELWLSQKDYGTNATKYRVEHKAAIEIEGRFYIINMVPVKFSAPEGLSEVSKGADQQESTPS